MRAPGLSGYLRLKEICAGARPPHGLRRGELPEHRRVLAPRHRHVHDSRRHLHPLVRHCNVVHGTPLRPTSTSRRGSPARLPRWSCSTPSSRRSIATTAGFRRLAFRRDDPRSPAVRPAPHRSAHPGFSRQRTVASNGARRATGCPQPQHRDRSLSLPYRRPGGRYDRALELLARAGRYAPDIPRKSGLMVGLGETWDEIVQVLQDLRRSNCGILTIGQPRPSLANLPRWIGTTPRRNSSS